MTDRNEFWFWYKFALFFAFCVLVTSIAQSQSGPITTPQLNTKYFVGTVDGFYPSIQSAVTAACATPGATVDIPAGVSPIDTIGSITGGCTTAGIVDERTLPSDYYKWVSPTYILQSSGGGANFPSTNGFVVNTSTSAARTGTPSDFYNNVQYTAGEMLYGFGDSIIAANLQGPSTVDKGFFARLCADYGGTCSNLAVGGTVSWQIAATVFAALGITDYNQPTKVFIDGGINDYIDCSVSAGCENNFILAMQAAIAWPGILYSNKMMASTATQTGTWGTNIPVEVNAQNLAGVVGTWLTGTTNGGTLTFPVSTSTVASVGNKIGVLYYVQAGNGTFTVSIDGTLQTDLCSGTTTFTDTGCNGVTSAEGEFEQTFPVTGASHTVVITQTSSAAIWMGGIDVAPTSVSPIAPMVIVPGIPKQLADADSSDSAAFNVLITSLVAGMQTENINLLFVDLRGGTPGVNDTTDMGNNSLCGSTNPGTQHFNDCGSFHYAQTVENAAAAAGVPFTIPNTGGRSGYFTQPLQTAGNANGDSVLQDWNPNVGQAAAGIFTGVSWATNNNNFRLRTSGGLDSFGNYAIQEMFTTNVPSGWGVYACNTAFPTAQSNCPRSFWIDAATGNTIANGTLQSAGLLFPSSQTVTGWQGTTGTKALTFAGSVTGTNVIALDSFGNAVETGLSFNAATNLIFTAPAGKGLGFVSPAGQGGSLGNIGVGGAGGPNAFEWDAFNTAILSNGVLSDGHVSANTDMSGVLTLVAGVASRPFTYSATGAGAAICIVQDITVPGNVASATTTATTPPTLTITGIGTDQVKYICVSKVPF